MLEQNIHPTRCDNQNTTTSENHTTASSKQMLAFPTPLPSSNNQWKVRHKSGNCQVLISERVEKLHQRCRLRRKKSLIKITVEGGRRKEGKIGSKRMGWIFLSYQIYSARLNI
jgi:hypothetical protein